MTGINLAQSWHEDRQENSSNPRKKMPLCVQSSCSLDKGSKTTYWEKRNLFKIGTGKTEHPHERKWGETGISPTYLQKKKKSI